MAEPALPLPFTPRALRAELAALYVGVSESWWLAAVKAGEAPAAIYLTPRLPVWLREDLDAWLDARAGRAAALAPNPCADSHSPERKKPAGGSPGRLLHRSRIFSARFADRPIERPIGPHRVHHPG